MPPVRSATFMNVDDHSKTVDGATSITSPLQISLGTHHLMHRHLTIPSKQCNQYGSSSPAIMQQQQHQRQQNPSGSSSQLSNQQHSSLTKAELRKVNN